MVVVVFVPPPPSCSSYYLSLLEDDLAPPSFPLLPPSDSSSCTLYNIAPPNNNSVNVALLILWRLYLILCFLIFISLYLLSVLLFLPRSFPSYVPFPSSVTPLFVLFLLSPLASPSCMYFSLSSPLSFSVCCSSFLPLHPSFHLPLIFTLFHFLSHTLIMILLTLTTFTHVHILSFLLYLSSLVIFYLGSVPLSPTIAPLPFLFLPSYVTRI